MRTLYPNPPIEVLLINAQGLLEHYRWIRKAHMAKWNEARGMGGRAKE